MTTKQDPLDLLAVHLRAELDAAGFTPEALEQRMEIWQKELDQFREEAAKALQEAADQLIETGEALQKGKAE